MIALEGGNFNDLAIIILLIMLGPPILLTIIGFAVWKNNNSLSKVLFILAGLYLIIGFGLCGSMLF